MRGDGLQRGTGRGRRRLTLALRLQVGGSQGLLGETSIRGLSEGNQRDGCIGRYMACAVHEHLTPKPSKPVSSTELLDTVQGDDDLKGLTTASPFSLLLSRLPRLEYVSRVFPESQD